MDPSAGEKLVLGAFSGMDHHACTWVLCVHVLRVRAYRKFDMASPWGSLSHTIAAHIPIYIKNVFIGMSRN